MINPKPIKRSPAIVQFSKDHHFALLLIWKIRQGLTFGIDTNRITKYINFYFQNFLEKHFKEEEELLIVNLDKNNELRQTAEEDHTVIRTFAKKLQIGSDTSLIKEFADRLESHIRFEERILFAQVQKIFSEDQLSFIAEQMEASHSNLNEDDYDDTFWIKNKVVIKYEL